MVSTKRVVLIGGGVRSGKSAFALQRAAQLGVRRMFIATAQAFDPEMTSRIERHQSERGGEYVTIEEPHELISALDRCADAEVVVVDCLTLWLSNLLLRGDRPQAIVERVDELVRVLSRCEHHSVLVTNEVGMGVVPPSPLGRDFRDVSGWAHQRLARVADEIYVGLLGAVLRLKPAPVALTSEGDCR